MSTDKGEVKKRKVAWGISGAGDRIEEYVEVMKALQRQYADTLDIHVFVSKAGEMVLKFYKLETTIKEAFPKFMVELNANSPFLAAWLQMNKYEFLLIAPASSNTVAKIANCIGDTMLTNAASMSLKAFVPVYVVPVDYEEKTLITKLPNGKDMKLRVRKEDAQQVRKLEQMEDVHVLADPHQIPDAFKKHFGQKPA
ncbi:MAG: archaeoflavoprotein AfpA [Candidatus Bathyarchaeota archaeon]|nr:archaeoflavoprotein AfpA [Candidatus Bathyarchaeota archaeon]